MEPPSFFTCTLDQAKYWNDVGTHSSSQDHQTIVKFLRYLAREFPDWSAVGTAHPGRIDAGGGENNGRVNGEEVKFEAEVLC